MTLSLECVLWATTEYSQFAGGMQVSEAATDINSWLKAHEVVKLTDGS